MGKCGLFLYSVQYPQGQPSRARSEHDSHSQAQAPEVASVRANHFPSAAARKLATLCRSRVLERRVERLISKTSASRALRGQEKRPEPTGSRLKIASTRSSK